MSKAKKTCVVLVAVLVTWMLAGAPNSFAEAIFLFRLKANLQAPRIDLGELMPGDWELVCDSHGYAGEFYLEKYKRTYPAVGALDDGAWGLVFISPDGSFRSTSGSCWSGSRIYLDNCRPRGSAVVAVADAESKCKLFTDRNDFHN